MWPGGKLLLKINKMAGGGDTYIATTSIVRCEVLCYMQNSLSQYPRDNVVTVVCDFYTTDELSAAKELLYDCVKKSGVDDTPVYVVRKGTDRRRSDTDIYELLQFGERMEINLPTFAAVTTRRVPTVTPSEVDVVALAVNLEALNSNVKSMSININALRETRSGNVCRLEASTQRDTSDLSTVNDPTCPAAVADNPTWATTAMNGAERWNVASSGNRPPRPPTVKGTRSTTPTVKGVPRAERRVTYFVGRIHKDTTEADVVDLLEECGVKDVKYTLIKAKYGRIFNTAAFRVSLPAAFRDICNSEETLPVDSEVRDWIFYPRLPDGSLSWSKSTVNR